MPSFKLIGISAIAIACAQMIALDAADARRGGGGGMRAGGFGGGGGMRAGGFGGGGMRAGSIGGSGRVGLAGGARGPHVSQPIARPGLGNRPGGPGWVGGPGNRPGRGGRPGYGYGPGYGYRPGYGWGAAALGTGLAYSAYNSGYYGGYDEGYLAPADVSYAAPSDAIAECARRFKTYDPASQTYVVRKGQRA